MTVTINAQASTGIAITSDGSGVIKLQSAGVTTNALAWVNFNGTNGASSAGYNVSSVTRTATGTYTVNFSSSLSDANYSVVGSGKFDAAGGSLTPCVGLQRITNALTTSAAYVAVCNPGSAAFDAATVMIAVFGN